MQKLGFHQKDIESGAVGEDREAQQGAADRDRVEGEHHSVLEYEDPVLPRVKEEDAGKEVGGAREQHRKADAPREQRAAAARLDQED